MIPTPSSRRIIPRTPLYYYNNADVDVTYKGFRMKPYLSVDAHSTVDEGIRASLSTTMVESTARHMIQTSKNSLVGLTRCGVRPIR